jgi:hypothetical protein
MPPLEKSGSGSALTGVLLPLTASFLTVDELPSCVPINAVTAGFLNRQDGGLRCRLSRHTVNCQALNAEDLFLSLDMAPGLNGVNGG